MAQGLPWREGDNLVVDDQEHPSNALPWLSLRRRGVDVRVASSGGHRYTVDDIWARVDAHAAGRAVLCSTPRACAATSRSCRCCAARDIWLVVDGIQGAGLLRARVDDWAWTRSPVARTRACSARWAWASCICRRRCWTRWIRRTWPSGGLSLDKSGPEWRVAAPDRQDARRLETGNLNYPGIAGWAGRWT